MRLSSPRVAVLLVAALLPLMGGCDQIGSVLHKVATAIGGGAGGAPGAGGMPGMPGMPGGGQMPPASVGFITVHPQSAPILVEVAGRTTASAVAEIRPQVSGIIEKRVFEEGSDVKAGDILYRIESSSYQAVLDAAKATLEKAEASVPSAQSKFDRYRELSGVNGVSQQDIDEARSALLQAKASVASAESSVKSAQINLDYTTVKAPISGVIGRSSITEGALVTANQTTALATIRQLDPIYVDLTASSSTMMRMRASIAGKKIDAASEGPKVSIRLDGDVAYPETGRIISTEANVDETTDTVTLRSSFANPQRQLLPGMYVRASVEIGSEDNVFLLPMRAVSRSVTGQATAMFVAADGTVEARALVADRSYGYSWVIEKGVKDGDRLIVDGLQKIRPGMNVKPLEVELDENGLVKQSPAEQGAPGQAPAGAGGKAS